MEGSRYFEALLSGSYNESSKSCISVHWDLESFITILQFTYGNPVEFTLTNFPSLLEGSLYFGVQGICLECESWLCGRKFIDDSGSLEISLSEIIAVWNFGIEHGIPFILDYCSAWLAQNFVGLKEWIGYIIRRNTKLIVLKAKGYRQLSSSDGRLHSVGCMPKYDFVGSATDGDNFDHALSRIFTWEELRLGWGFYPSSLKILDPSIQMLRAINVGVGAQLGELAVTSLPKLCPLLESVSLCFQVISYSAVRNILRSLKNLQVFELCCCLGDLTSNSFKIILPNLRRLKLQRVTPWMTDMDLILLTHSCRNLSELSLSGCKHLSLDSQGIISRGWPGLSLIHLEDCGNMTLDGISSLMDCKAVEDLLLRHNGPGIRRNFIINAASKLPLLRKLALDLCDARDGGFDSPSATGRFFLRTVTIARCRSERCAFVLPNVAGQKHTMHKESIVLEWNSEELRTYIVEERV